MTKIEKSNQKINPFGGINFVINEIDNIGLSVIIDNQLGTRPAQAQYSYSDLIKSLWSIYFCGGDCAEDINEHLKDYFQDVQGLTTPNSDTILGVLKNLKTSNQIVKNKKGEEYEINKHDQLNRLNISAMLQMNLLKRGEYYDFDYDNEALETEKFDTKMTYKKFKGYFPGMATIAGMPVYFENRDGNMNVKHAQEEVLERCFKMLIEHDIHVRRARFDCGSYTKNIINTVEKYSKLFYVRAMRCQEMFELIKEIKQWKTVEINYIQYEVASIEYQPFGCEKKYRLVISREKTNNGQIDIFTKDNLKYRSILTNDWFSTEKEAIEYYNARAAEERTIDVLNNDFGWSKMPFSFMNENTVFLMIMMICKNVYTYIIGKFCQTISWLKENFRLKKFIFRFITVPAKWVKKGGQKILKIFTKKDYNFSYT